MDKIDKTYKGYSRWLLKNFASRNDKLKRERMKKSENFDSIIAISYDRRKSITKKGADLLPGDYYVVPVGQTLDTTLYESGEKQYLITCITDYFFFFIPFRYAEYVVEFKDKSHFNFDSFDGNGVGDIIYECDNWNKRCNYKLYSNSGSVSFGKDGSWDNYDLGDNDYHYMIEVGAENSSDSEED